MFVFKKLFFASLLGLGFCAPLLAASVQISLQALDDALAEPDTSHSSSALSQIARSQISQAIEDAELRLNDGALLFEQEYVDTVVEEGCTSTTIRSMQAQIVLQGNSGLTFKLESLFEPVSLELQIEAAISATGRAKQTFGVRLGRCRELATDNFSFSAAGNLQTTMTAQLSLNPVWLDSRSLRLRPVVQIDGEAGLFALDVDVDDSLLRGLLESFLLREIEDAFGPTRIADQFEVLESSVSAQLATAGNDTIDLLLPDPDSQQISALYNMLTEQSRFPLTLEHVQRNRFELLAALLIQDNDALLAITEDAAICQLSSVFQKTLTAAPLYRVDQGSCVAYNPNVSTAVEIENLQLYAEQSCSNTVDFYGTTLAEYCDLALDASAVGNASSNAHELGRWTLSPGNTFDIGALSIAGASQPYMQRQQYKSVFTAEGACQLEMRIYVTHPNAREQRPVIALHGGSWQYRQAGFIGIENTVTHLVNQGLAVFAPFYRLAGSKDGPRACQGASLSEITSDVNDALDWVVDNASRYGASGKPIVFGQSAGAHLATGLAVNRADRVQGLVSFYGPVDFADIVAEYENGNYADPSGVTTIEAVTGAPLEQLDVNSILIRDNSFPARVASHPVDFPPVFLLHGGADELVPARQSVRLCNAYAGDPNRGPATTEIEFGPLRRVFNCDDRDSQMHSIAEGDHALDICLFDQACASGSEASAELVGDSVQQAVLWMQEQYIDASTPIVPDIQSPDAEIGNSATDHSMVSNDNSAIAVGGGGSFWWLMVFLCGLIWLAGGGRPSRLI